MASIDQPIEDLLYVLGERAKELNCLYKVEELLGRPDTTLPAIFQGVIRTIPQGMQYHSICQARIRHGAAVYEADNPRKAEHTLTANIVVQEKVEGTIEVYYTQSVSPSDGGTFLKEERKLVNTIAERLSNYILHQRLRGIFNEWQTLKQEMTERRKPEWRVMLEMLHSTDQNLYTRLSRKMLNHLCWNGIREANQLLQRFSPKREAGEADEDLNQPQRREELHSFIDTSDEIFQIASQNMSDDDLSSFIQKWIKDDKSSFLLVTLENLDTSLAEVADAVGKYFNLFPDGAELSHATSEVLRVSLIMRFFTEQLSFINIAKKYIDLIDFHELLQRILYHQKSHGKLGGKSSGLFLAERILKKVSTEKGLLENIRVPKTWYLASDAIMTFIHYNNLEEVFNHKYLEIDQIREEYPHIVQVFKNSYFPPDLVKGLSHALDDLGDRPIIVRSSSLLEDNMAAAFAGKYKSLFLANTGTKSERLAALMDAIAEVYASLFGPDPIEYRAERGLLDFHEEMGIMIQEVVGTRVGRYFCPAFAGVAFSNNEFRWSPRIRREDGLIRMVPGLGTRAVDRLSDDYPTLIAPGQPSLRVNVSPDEMARYSPKKIDVIDLEQGKFVTIDVRQLLRECGHDYPLVNRIVSIIEDDHVRQPMGFNINFDRPNIAVTFNGLIENTTFVKQLHCMLTTLQEKLQTPVDIEFAADGKNLYLLQCRPQSFSAQSAPAPIPRDIPRERLIFSASRHISNGRIPDITHIVYVNPVAYSELGDRTELQSVGRAVGKLNNILPKRQFILMGPGRWGSRGDIRLGVNITYSDINNTAALIEVARKQGNYIPDLSFGTHFFQDLVEASIRYIPLYPDDPGIAFNEVFLTRANNMLSEILPEYESLKNVIHVIDVPANSDGLILRVLMNADLDEAVGFLAQPSNAKDFATGTGDMQTASGDDHWTWRTRMAERIAGLIEYERFGVAGMYLIGSAKNATAGPKSDIDLLIHHRGTEEARKEMLQWLKGWSQCLAELNYLRTGYRVDSMLDVHVVTDDDMAKKTSFATKINAITDAARPLPMMKRPANA
jgi:pyruvate, water dikinase